MPLELVVGLTLGLCGALGVVWRWGIRLNDELHEEKRESTRLIFGLLQRLAIARGELPPPTLSTPENPQAIEAKALALKEIDGELEDLLRAYLDSERPTKNERKARQ